MCIGTTQALVKKAITPFQGLDCNMRLQPGAALRFAQG